MRIKRLSTRAVALALLAVSLLATVSFADAQQQAPKSNVTVPVHFVSRPDYADLYIDGKFVGSTDLSLRLQPGARTIEIKRDGYASWRRELIVSAGNPTRVAAVLAKVEKEP
jgi:hypothetical protein